MLLTEAGPSSGRGVLPESPEAGTQIQALKQQSEGRFRADPAMKLRPQRDNLTPGRFEHRLVSNANLNYIGFRLSKNI